jgi:dienelactone hydrolase
VVLVHGSGPQDRDESIGPNKPFRDLAWGLSSRGIAVLRYEKRTRAHPADMQKIVDHLTVKEETIDDALAAVELLRHRREVDAKALFVLGHSLGGSVAPRIGKADGRIAGLIVMAGSTRPLEDLIVEQTRFILSRDGELSEDDKARIKTLETQATRVKDPSLAPGTPASDLPLGVHAAYWLDLRKNDPSAVASTIQQPMLILQGEADYQVTMKDLARWRQGLEREKRVTIKTYAKLNHLFMAGEGPIGPAQYEKPGHMDEKVVVDIAAWIRQVSGYSAF